MSIQQQQCDEERKRAEEEAAWAEQDKINAYADAMINRDLDRNDNALRNAQFPERINQGGWLGHTFTIPAETQKDKK